VQFLGYVEEDELVGILRSAMGLVMPSLFEASSLPIFEAWREGIPVASSNTTAMPGQVGAAGLLFDPMDVEAMARAIAALVTDEELRCELSARGRRRLDDFDWDRSARCYRAMYRRVAGRTLTEDERTLLAWDWMADPGRYS
jgi:glycosyltransferase involved in cell wall biosynthesis